MTNTYSSQLLKKLPFLSGIEHFLKGLFWLSSADSIGIMCSFVLSLLFARLLSPKEYGHYSYIQSLFSLLLILGLPGLNVTLIKSIVQKKFGLLTYISGLAFISALTGSVIMALWPIVTRSQDSSGFLIAGLLFPFYNVGLFISPYFQGLKQFKTASLLSAVITLVTTTLLVTVMITGFKQTSTLLVASYLPFIVINAVVLIRFLRIYELPAKKQVKTIIAKELRYGVELTALDLLPNIAFNLDKVLIGLMLKPEELAIYVFAVNIPETLKGFAKHIGSVLLPALSSVTPQKAKQKLLASTPFSLLITIICIFGYIVTAPFIYTYLFPLYSSASRLSQLYSLSLIIIPSFVFTSFFRAYNYKKKLMVTHTVYSATQILLLLLFVPNFGLTGAVLAKIIARLLLTLVSLALFI